MIPSITLISFRPGHQQVQPTLCCAWEGWLPAAIWEVLSAERSIKPHIRYLLFPKNIMSNQLQLVSWEGEGEFIKASSFLIKPRCSPKYLIELGPILYVLMLLTVGHGQSSNLSGEIISIFEQARWLKQLHFQLFEGSFFLTRSVSHECHHNHCSRSRYAKLTA